MKIWFSKYSLEPIKNTSKLHHSNRGVLLKYEDETYSLYHPIESLGDLSLDEFIKNIKVDNELNKRVKYLSCDNDCFKGMESVKLRSYYSALSLNYLLENSEEISHSGFRTVKIKVSSVKELEENIAELKKKPFKYIFDFNAREVKESFDGLNKEMCSFFKERVVYLEDPSIKTPDLKGVLLASDFINYEGSEDITVVKPTGFCHKTPNFVQPRVVVTSYLDHPFGQMMSALWAFKKGITLECGLHSHNYYCLNKYSALFSRNPYFDFHVAKDFFKLLKNENWTLS